MAETLCKDAIAPEREPPIVEADRFPALLPSGWLEARGWGRFNSGPLSRVGFAESAEALQFADKGFRQPYTRTGPRPTLPS
jgi:hypothetical protein